MSNDCGLPEAGRPNSRRKQKPEESHFLCREMREKERILSVSCTNDDTKFMKIMPILMMVEKGGMNRFKNLGFQTLQQRKGTSWIDITGCANNFVLAIKLIEKAP